MILLAVAGALSVGEGSRIYIKAILAQILLQNAWSQTQNGQSQVKPWPWADTYPVARLEVATLGADMIVLAGSTGATLAFGPGHVGSSKRPGEAGVVVIGGHRDTHFSILREMEIGDPIFIEDTQGKRYAYPVMKIAVRHKDEVTIIVGVQNQFLVLATCFPFEGVVPGGPERFLVIAEQVSD